MGQNPHIRKTRSQTYSLPNEVANFIQDEAVRRQATISSVVTEAVEKMMAEKGR